MKETKICVMSRKVASEYAHGKAFFDNHNYIPSVIISITDIWENHPSLPKTTTNKIRDILSLKFEDTELEREDGITDNDAKQIAQFVDKYFGNIDMIIVHCEAGVSRSAGCAAAIMKFYRGDDTPIFDNGHYVPNMLVYRKVLNALNQRKEERKNMERGEQEFD